jgi:CDP-diglyceride synthetase
MSTYLSAVLITTCLAMGIWTAITAARNRLLHPRHLYGLATIELLLLVQLVVGVVAVAQGEGPDATATFVSYLIGVLFVLPVAALWALAERSRPAVLVITVGCAAVAVMTGRLLQIWEVGGG